MKDHGSSSPDIWLALFAKLVVLFTFVLIFVGGHTTTSGAGMAFPDWPLSHNSVNPAGWWDDVFQRLEHGHRLIAESVGMLIGVLCAWVWRNKLAFPLAFGVSILFALIAYFAGVSRETLAHIGLWSAAAVFIVVLLAASPMEGRRGTVRWIVFAAFMGVCVQAVLGGLRVTIESGGNPALATAFRVFHGSFAQFELSLLVCVAAMLSPKWQTVITSTSSREVARVGWWGVAVLFLQLLVGATMRHLGAGLAIPFFPQATAEGKWMPAVHNAFVDLNFTHTRFGAMVAAGMILWLGIKAMRSAKGRQWMWLPGAFLIGLVVLQVLLGVYVIWSQRSALLTTSHVVNGAALLATTVLLALRASYSGSAVSDGETVEANSSGEVHP